MGQLQAQNALRPDGTGSFAQRRLPLARQVLPDAVGDGLIEDHGAKRQVIEIGADELDRLVPSEFAGHAPRGLHRRKGTVHPHDPAADGGGRKRPSPPTATQIQNRGSRRGFPRPAGNGVARQPSGQAGIHAAMGHSDRLRNVAIHGLEATTAAGEGTLAGAANGGALGGRARMSRRVR